MSKASGSTRYVNPSTQNRSQSVSDFKNALSSGKYNTELSYLPPTGSGSMLYQNGHNYHIEEIEVGRALADKGYKVILTPEGIEAYATAFTKDGRPKYSEGTISGILYDQKTTESNVTNFTNNVDHAIKHARDKGAEVALIYDRYGKMHRQDIENGMKKYKKYDKTDKIKAVLVMDKDLNLYEHQFNK